jgi:hypothetical protein|uniref:Uncharacterized protein n=1 Tax=Zea mays TaxID=4577 RepID=A0A804NXS4_MAIZE
MAAPPQGEDERRRCGGAWCGTVELRVRMNCEREVKNAFSGMHERLVIRHSGPLAWPGPYAFASSFRCSPALRPRPSHGGITLLVCALMMSLSAVCTH